MENKLTSASNPFTADMGLPASDDPSFGETWRAQLGYQYGPVLDSVLRSYEFAEDDIREFDVAEHMTAELAPFASFLGKARSEREFNDMLAQIERGEEYRQTMADAGVWMNLGAGVLDPFNIIPLGGGAVAGVGRGTMAGVRAGAGAMATLEAARAPFDPLATPEEVGLNVGFGAAFGGVLGGIGGANRARVAGIIDRAKTETQRTMAALTGFTPEEFAVARRRENRRFADEPDLEKARRGADEETLNEIDLEHTIRRQEALEAGDPLDPTPVENVFNDSFINKMVTTPMKRVLQSDAPVPVKQLAQAIAGDGGILARANQLGHKFPPSVYQRAKLWEGHYVRQHDQLVKIWADRRGGATVIGDQNISNMGARLTGGETFEEFTESLTRKYIMQERDLTPLEEQGIDVLRKYFMGWEERLHDAGVLGRQKRMEQLAKEQSEAISALEARIKELEGLSVRDYGDEKLLDLSRERLTRTRSRREQTLARIEEMRKPIMPENEDVFFPRFWNHDQIRNNSQDFGAILAKWFKENPETWVWKEGKGRVKQRLSTEPEKIQQRVNDTIRRILGDDDPSNPDVFVGAGKAKHFKQRDLDIPNHLVIDFIHTNADQVMHGYTKRVASRYEFAKRFGADDIDDLLSRARQEVIEGGGTIEQANKHAADIRVLYDRVVGTTRRHPNTWKAKTANTIRDMAMLNYLGSTGLTAMVEPAHIIKEHGLARTFQSIFGYINDNKVRAASKHVRAQYAEALEGVVGSTGARFSEDMTNNPFMKTFADRAKNTFFLLNGLTPITQALKHLDGIARGDTFHRYMTAMVDGTADEQQIQYMLMHGIDKADAEKLLAMPWETSDAGLKLPNIDDWVSQVDRSKVRQRVARRMKAKKRAGERIVVNPFDEKSREAFMKEHGDHFFTDFVQTNKEIVEARFNRRFKERYGTDVPEDAWLIGFHEYFDDGPGTIYLHKENIRQVWEFHHGELQGQGKMKALEELEAAFKRGDVDEEAYVHHKSFFENADLFDTVEEFEEFIMMHELHHGIIRQKPGQSLAELEAEIDAAAVDWLRGNRKRTIEAMTDAEMRVAQDEIDELRVTWNSAMSTGILNTILMGTPADKPTVVDGVVLVPQRIGQKFGLKPDPKYLGYARIEDPLMGLPFQFYSYSLAAVNKITGRYATGQVRHRAAGIAATMVLGYMVVDAKTPDYAMDRMSIQDKVARAFDAGGLAPIYSDMAYTALTTTLAMGGPNITGGVIQPKFAQEPDPVGGVVGLAGAGPNITYDIGRATADLIAGDHGEGAKQLIRNMPFMRLWMIKQFVNEQTMNLDQALGDGQPEIGGRF